MSGRLAQLRVAVALAALGFAWCVGLFAPGLYAALDARLGDLAWQAFPEPAPERRVVIVDIDEASLAAIGPWPWPRATLAALSDRLAALGASLQVYDVVFPDPRPGDERLAAAWTGRPVVLSQILPLGAGQNPRVGTLRGAAVSPACADLPPAFPRAQGYIANAAPLAAATGHITPNLDPDGAVRTVPALVCADGHAYPALDIAAFLEAAGLPARFELAPGRGLLDPPWRLIAPALPGIGVPLDGAGAIRIPYRRPRAAFAAVSAADVLQGKADPALFRNVWALVGATAFGIGDAVPTPQGGAVAGIEVHAQLLTALLDDSLPWRPRAAAAFQWLLALAGLGLLLAVAARQRRPVVILPPAGLLLGVAFLAGQVVLLGTRGLWVGGAFPALAVALGGIALGVLEHRRTRHERQLAYRNLASYLPETAASRLAFRAPAGNLEAARRQVVVLVADLRNFSAWCESRPPEDVAAILHAFFTAAERQVSAHGGTIEEYAGDAVMAVWTVDVPEKLPDLLAAALAAGADLLAALPAVLPDADPADAQTDDQAGLAPLALGIGIETGTALVGSFGPAQRRTHSVLGEPVSVAVRLQAMTAELAEPLLLGPAAAAGLAGRPEAARLLPLGEFLLEGLRQPRRLCAWRASAPPLSSL